MHRIYARAETTIAWLGPASDDSSEALQALTTTGREAIQHGILDYTPEELRSFDLTDDAGRPPRALVDLADRLGWNYPFLAVRKLYDRPYWTRLWVLQEFTLPKHLVIQCGLDVIADDHLRAGHFFLGILCRRMLSNISANELELPIEQSDDFEVELDGDGKPLSKADLLRLKPSHHYAYVLASTRHRHQSWSTNASLTAAPLIRLFDTLQLACVLRFNAESRFQVSDPRDYVYGLLGVIGNVSPTSLGLTVDYTLTPESLFTTTAQAMLENGTLRVLRYAGSKDHVDMPSWAPDWRSHLFSISWDRDPFVPHGNLPVEAPTFDRTRTMFLRGVIIDSIKQRHSTWDFEKVGNSSDLVHSIRLFLRDIRDLVLDMPQPDIPGMTARRWAEEAYWRVPIADQLLAVNLASFERAASEAGDGWEGLVSGWPGPYEALYLGSVQNIRRTTVVSTLKGTLGLTSRAAQIGDFVVIVPGLGAPLVMRHVTDKNSYWQIVGEAFVYGMMDGEAITQATKLQTLNVR